MKQCTDKVVVVLLIATMLLLAVMFLTFLRATQAQCERGNVTREHIAHPIPPVDCGYFSQLEAF